MLREPALAASEARMAKRSRQGVSEGHEGRSERPATEHGHPRPTQDADRSVLHLLCRTELARARSERPATEHGHPRPTQDADRSVLHLLCRTELARCP
jgi:hypothetical protein